MYRFANLADSIEAMTYDTKDIECDTIRELYEKFKKEFPDFTDHAIEVLVFFKGNKHVKTNIVWCSIGDDIRTLSETKRMIEFAEEFGKHYTDDTDNNVAITIYESHEVLIEVNGIDESSLPELIRNHIQTMIKGWKRRHKRE